MRRKRRQAEAYPTIDRLSAMPGKDRGRRRAERRPWVGSEVRNRHQSAGRRAADHFASSLEIVSPPLRVISLLRTILLIWLVIGATLPSHLAKFAWFGCMLDQYVTCGDPGGLLGMIGLLMVRSILVLMLEW